MAVAHLSVRQLVVSLGGVRVLHRVAVIDAVHLGGFQQHLGIDLGRAQRCGGAAVWKAGTQRQAGARPDATQMLGLWRQWQMRPCAGRVPLSRGLGGADYGALRPVGRCALCGALPAAVSVVKKGFPVPAPKMTTLCCSRCVMALGVRKRGAGGAGWQQRWSVGGWLVVQRQEHVSPPVLRDGKAASGEAGACRNDAPRVARNHWRHSSSSTLGLCNHEPSHALASDVRLRNLPHFDGCLHPGLHAEAL